MATCGGFFFVPAGWQCPDFRGSRLHNSKGRLLMRKPGRRNSSGLDLADLFKPGATPAADLAVAWHATATGVPR
jgi:hypothetical protein